MIKNVQAFEGLNCLKQKPRIANNAWPHDHTIDFENASIYF